MARFTDAIRAAKKRSVTINPARYKNRATRPVNVRIMIEFQFEKVGETEKGVKFQISQNRAVWFPKSKIKYSPLPMGGDLMNVEIPEWLAKANDLI
jgi:hypothetical protein